MIGSQIIFTIFLMLLFPHFELAPIIFKGILKCFDRHGTMNRYMTKQVIQEDYEKLYIGPEFNIQIRLGQVMTIIFVTMTYSSGLPILYFVSLIVFIVFYWTDKYMLLRFYKKSPQLTGELSKRAIQFLPMSAAVHCMFGLVMFSYPYILKSRK